MKEIPFHEWRDRLLVALLNAESRDGVQPALLKLVCEAEGLVFDEQRAIDFLNQYKHLGSGFAVADYITFALNADGRKVALEAREMLAPQSFTDKLASDKFQKIGNLTISIFSLFISLGALAVAAIALWNT